MKVLILAFCMSYILLTVRAKKKVVMGEEEDHAISRCIADSADVFFKDGSTVIFLHSGNVKTVSYTVIDTMQAIDMILTMVPFKIESSNECPHNNLSYSPHLLKLNPKHVNTLKRDSRTGVLFTMKSTTQEKNRHDKLLTDLHAKAKWRFINVRYANYSLKHSTSDIRGHLIIMNDPKSQYELYYFNLIIHYMDIIGDHHKIVIAFLDTYGTNREASYTLYGTAMYRLYNVVVLLPDKTGGMKAYTWYPYSSLSKKCTNKKMVTTLGSCNAQNGWVIEPKESSFTVYHPKECHMKVNIMQTLKPFIKIYRHRGFQYEEGVLPSMLKILAKRINKDFKMQLLVISTQQQREFDLIIQNMHFHDIFEQTFGQMYVLTLKYFWFVKRAEPFPFWASMSRVFSMGTWVALFASIVIAGVTSRCLKQYDDSIKSLLDSWSVVLGIGVNNIPSTTKTRLFFLSWVLYSFAINTVFQAFVISYFFDPGLQHQISTYQEISDNNYTKIYENVRHAYSESEEVDSSVYLANPHHSIQYLFDKRKVAIFTNEDTSKYIFKDFCHAGATEKIYKMKDGELQDSYYIHFKDILVRAMFEKRIRWMTEGGIITKITSDLAIGSQLHSPERLTIIEIVEEYQTMKLINLQSLLLLYGFGLVLSFTSFICEVVTHVLKKRAWKCT